LGTKDETFCDPEDQMSSFVFNRTRGNLAAGQVKFLIEWNQLTNCVDDEDNNFSYVSSHDEDDDSTCSNVAPAQTTPDQPINKGLPKEIKDWVTMMRNSWKGDTSLVLNSR
jgi:hypothetical protein